MHSYVILDTTFTGIELHTTSIAIGTMKLCRMSSNSSGMFSLYKVQKSEKLLNFIERKTKHYFSTYNV